MDIEELMEELGLTGRKIKKKHRGPTKVCDHAVIALLACVVCLLIWLFSVINVMIYFYSFGHTSFSPLMNECSAARRAI